MFYFAPSFNQPLNDWDVSKVTDFVSAFFFKISLMMLMISNMITNLFYLVISTPHKSLLFTGTSSFNQPLDKWDVTSGTNFVSKHICFDFINSIKLVLTLTHYY